MSTETLQWYCARSLPKQEHIAASSLRLRGIEAFNPRIRFRRLTCRGSSRVTESLFPGYLFARFDLAGQLDQVRFSRGIHSVVRFGFCYPILDPQLLADMRNAMASEDCLSFDNPLRPGDEVLLAHPAFRGWRAVVEQVLPARQRVRVLMDFLGSSRRVELDRTEVVPGPDRPWDRTVEMSVPG